MRILIAVLALCLATPAFAAKPTYPTLTDSEKEKLADGKLVMRKNLDGDDAGSIVGVQRIQASEADVWRLLLAFERIPESNDSIVLAEDYTAEMSRTAPSGARYIDVHYELSVGGQHVQYNLHHTYYPSQRYLVWTLDDQKDNDIESTVGSFSTWPVEGSSDQVDFLYITRVRTGRSVPGWVESLLTKTSLKGYFKFVRKEAEK